MIACWDKMLFLCIFVITNIHSMRLQAERLAAVRDFNSLKSQKKQNYEKWHERRNAHSFQADKANKVLYETRQTGRLNQSSKDKTENQYLTRAAMREWMDWILIWASCCWFCRRCSASLRSCSASEWVRIFPGLFAESSRVIARSAISELRDDVMLWLSLLRTEEVLRSKIENSQGIVLKYEKSTNVRMDGMMLNGAKLRITREKRLLKDHDPRPFGKQSLLSQAKFARAVWAFFFPKRAAQNLRAELDSQMCGFITWYLLGISTAWGALIAFVVRLEGLNFKKFFFFR